MLVLSLLSVDRGGTFLVEFVARLVTVDMRTRFRRYSLKEASTVLRLNRFAEIEVDNFSSLIQERELVIP